MKKNNATKSAALAALMSLMQMPSAHAEGHTFTPIENLPPEQRQEISKKLAALTSNLDIDWDNIVIGINENGQISFVSKDDTSMQIIGSFSCLTTKSKDCSK